MIRMDNETSVLAPSVAEVACVWFHRVVAVYCLLFGILYWIRLAGFFPGANWRFDLMPVPWQIASVVLGVMFPFAANGLWMKASWGPVIWFVCAATEVLMFAGFPEIFGARPMVLVSHGLVIALYLAFFAYIRRQRQLADA